MAQVYERRGGGTAERNSIISWGIRQSAANYMHLKRIEWRETNLFYCYNCWQLISFALYARAGGGPQLAERQRWKNWQFPRSSYINSWACLCRFCFWLAAIESEKFGFFFWMFRWLYGTDWSWQRLIGYRFCCIWWWPTSSFCSNSEVKSCRSKVVFEIF